MSEFENQPQYPVSFETIVKHSEKTGYQRIYIGNSGGIYSWNEGTDYFRQDFTPDGSYDVEDNPQRRIQYSLLYPAALWHLIKWQQSLPSEDGRGKVTTIEGVTNRVMSEFRAKLLGNAYVSQQIANPQNPSNELFKYTIDLEVLTQNTELMKRLEKYAAKAKRMEFSTVTPPLKAGKLDNLTIGEKDLA